MDFAIPERFVFIPCSFTYRQKLGMLLDTLKDDENGTHCDDELLKMLSEIAMKSASERTTIER